MACMCGDLYCRSCGPAQGNHRCDACGRWNLDGGCADPAKCGAELKQFAEAEERMDMEMCEPAVLDEQEDEDA